MIPLFLNDCILIYYFLNINLYPYLMINWKQNLFKYIQNLSSFIVSLDITL